jgi:chromosome segregation ATPase
MGNFSRKPAAMNHIGFGRYEVVNRDGRVLETLHALRPIAEAKAKELGVEIFQTPKAKPKRRRATTAQLVDAGNEAVRRIAEENQRVVQESEALKAKVAELEKMNAQQAANMAEALTSLEMARKELVEVQTNVDWWRKQAGARQSELREAEGREKSAHADRDRYRTQAEADREALRKLEAAVERERGYIEGLLDRQHPERPRLPWEPREQVIDGNIEHGRW